MECWSSELTTIVSVLKKVCNDRSPGFDSIVTEPLSSRTRTCIFNVTESEQMNLKLISTRLRNSPTFGEQLLSLVHTSSSCWISSRLMYELVQAIEADMYACGICTRISWLLHGVKLSYQWTSQKGSAVLCLPYNPITHPQHFQPQLIYIFPNLGWHSLKCDVAIFNSSWSTTKHAQDECQKPTQNAEGSGKYPFDYRHFQSLHNSWWIAALDLYAGTIPAAFVATVKTRSYTFIKNDEACFHTSLGWATSLARSENKSDVSCLEECSVDLQN